MYKLRCRWYTSPSTRSLPLSCVTRGWGSAPYRVTFILIYGNFLPSRAITVSEHCRAEDARHAAGIVLTVCPCEESMSEASPIPENATNDEKLMLAFSQGSVEAFAELFRRYKQPIYGFFRRRVTDAAHAEELAQETFLGLVRSATRYEPRALFRTYLYAIALKILRNYRRNTAFRALFMGQRKAGPDPAKHDATESALWVRGAVAKLEGVDREILMLREYEQLSYAEIADLLSIPVNTVRSRLFRARMALRELLEPSGAKLSKAHSTGLHESVLGGAQLAMEDSTGKGERG
jgi:RNA polymerase sigma-70 factor, ECF subfamily